MSQPREQTAPTNPASTVADAAPRPNGMTDEQVRDALAALGHRKDDPEYVERVFGEAEKVRRRLNAKFLRQIEAQEQK